jgi:hypothetical protein
MLPDGFAFQLRRFGVYCCLPEQRWIERARVGRGILVSAQGQYDIVS